MALALRQLALYAVLLSLLLYCHTVVTAHAELTRSYTFEAVNVTRLGSGLATIKLSNVLPVVTVRFNITSVYLEYSVSVQGQAPQGYTLRVRDTPRYAGFELELIVEKGGDVVYYAVFTAQPWMVYSHGSGFHAVIEYKFDVYEVRELPEPDTIVTVAYTSETVEKLGVIPGLPSTSYDVIEGKPVLVAWSRRDRLTKTIVWPSLWPSGSTLYTPDIRGVRYVFNGTHEKIEIIGNLSEQFTALVGVSYASEEYVKVYVYCPYGCDSACEKTFAVVEVYNASNTRFLGVAGIASQCLLLNGEHVKQIVYVRVPHPIYLRIVLVEDEGSSVRVLSDTMVLVQKPFSVKNRLAAMVMAALLVGSVLTGALRRSIRDASIALTAGSIALYFAAPSLGAYQYANLYIALAGAGILTLIVVLFRGE